MKFLVILSVAVACVAADVSHVLKDEYNAAILKSAYDINPEGSFAYTYETANGIAAQAQGIVKNPANEYPSLEVQGGYKYISPDGTPIEISYVADELGYHPTGNAIPTPHPIPEYIARSLAYIQAHPPQEAASIAKPAAYLLG